MTKLTNEPIQERLKTSPPYLDCLMTFYDDGDDDASSCS